MSKFTSHLIFSRSQKAVLAYLYEHPAAELTTYSLVGLVLYEIKGSNPFEMGTGEWRVRLQEDQREMQSTVEFLLAERLIKGDRIRDHNGFIYHGSIKLTQKGESEYLKYRNQPPLGD